MTKYIYIVTIQIVLLFELKWSILIDLKIYGGRKMSMYGYIRVSSRDQNPDRQIIAMREYGVEDKNMYLDKVSGKDFNRPRYKKLLRKVREGDVIVIKSIDRLGRDYEEIIAEWKHITNDIGADIHVLDMSLLNTNTAHGDLTGRLIADMVLQILAYVAETERTFIKQRQKEGIAAAKEKGVKFGARKKELPPDFDRYHKLWIDKKITIRQAADDLGISPATFYRRCIEKND